MSATRRGANSRLSAKLRRREDAAWSPTEEVAEAEEAQNPEAEEETPEPVTDAEKAALEEFTVAQLKERLVSLNLSIRGRKADLIARLLEAAG